MSIVLQSNYSNWRMFQFALIYDVSYLDLIGFADDEKWLHFNRMTRKSLSSLLWIDKNITFQNTGPRTVEPDHYFGIREVFALNGSAKGIIRYTVKTNRVEWWLVMATTAKIAFRINKKIEIEIQSK